MFQKSFSFYLLAFISGIAIASWSPESYLKFPLYIFTSAIALLVVAVFVYWFWPRVSRPHAILLFCSLAFLILGLWRYSLSIFQPTPKHIANYVNQKLELTATIVAEPELRPDQTRYQVGDIKLINKAQTLEGVLLVASAINPELHYGDRVSLSCRLQAPAVIDGFAYDRYLAKSDIYAICYRPTIELLSPANFNLSTDWQGTLYSKIYQFKNVVRQIYIASLGEDESSLANGIILGDQKIMNTQLRQDYASSGLAHIIAISGMNMTLISAFVLILLIFLGLWRRQAYYATLVLLWLYTIMIGLPASAVRASIMSSLLLTALTFGRLAKIERLLLIVASLMLMANPRLLRDDIGFQLSFAAFLGVVYFYQPLVDWLKNFKLFDYLPTFVEEGLAMTVAAQLLSWPIMINNFNQLSIIAPLANILALPLLAPVMVLLVVTGLLAGLAPGLSLWIFGPVSLILRYLNWLATNFGQLTWAVWVGDDLNILLMFSYYCCMIYIIRKMTLNRL